jgi:lysophospholipase L1-like esterase
MNIIEQATSFVMKHKMPIAIAIAAIAAIVLSFALKKKEKYYDYESSPTTIPSPPEWVQGDPEKSDRAVRRNAGKRNANIVQTANTNNERYDFVLYGDSITMIAADNHMDVWNKYFGQNGMKSAPLGVGGDTIQKLSWRVSLGKERFAIPPKVVGLLIGINNIGLESSDPVIYLDTFLLPYLKAVYPTSQILLIGLLPQVYWATKESMRTATNNNYMMLAKKYRTLSALTKKYDMHYIDISKGLVPADTKQLYDGLHPTAAGYEIIYRNLRPYVLNAMKNAK